MNCVRLLAMQNVGTVGRCLPFLLLVTYILVNRNHPQPPSRNSHLPSEPLWASQAIVISNLKYMIYTEERDK